jgi:hypothetical protein
LLVFFSFLAGGGLACVSLASMDVVGDNYIQSKKRHGVHAPLVEAIFLVDKVNQHTPSLFFLFWIFVNINLVQ